MLRVLVSFGLDNPPGVPLGVEIADCCLSNFRLSNNLKEFLANYECLIWFSVRYSRYIESEYMISEGDPKLISSSSLCSSML